MRTPGFGLKPCTPTIGVFPIRSRTDSSFTGAGRARWGSAPGDRGEDRDDVAVGDLGVELVEVPDVVVVDVDVHELVQRTVAVDQLALEARVRRHQLLEHLADGRAVGLDRGGAVRRGAEQGGKTYFDGHGLSLSGARKGPDRAARPGPVRVLDVFRIRCCSP